MTSFEGMSRAARVYWQLLDDIAEGHWGRDEILSAYSLANRLGVSRTPVVEALKRLESEGVIEILPNVGCRLRGISQDACTELFALTDAVLGVAVERAARLADERSLRRMDELIDALEEAVERSDTAAARWLTEETRRALIEAGLPAHAPAADRLLRSLSAEFARNDRLQIGPREVASRRQIVEALRARSPGRARLALERQIAAVAAEVEQPPRTPSADAPARPAALEHAELRYGSTAEFIASALPFVLGAVQWNEPALVVSRQENLNALASALGTHGTRVDYRDSSDWYDDPLSTLRRYRHYIERRSGTTRVSIVGELPWHDRSETAVADWLRYESVINVALEPLPASIVCPYDAQRLPAEILSEARAAHPRLCSLGNLSYSRDYREFFTTAS
jgi:DNA-binding GntR family transcriptional regulator